MALGPGSIFLDGAGRSQRPRLPPLRLGAERLGALRLGAERLGALRLGAERLGARLRLGAERLGARYEPALLGRLREGLLRVG